MSEQKKHFQISNYITKIKPYPFSVFTDKNYQKFFLNDFLHYQSTRRENPGKVQKGLHNILDLDGEYVHNKYGYRSQEFKKDIKVVFSGDSFTYGVGIPENGIWSTLVSDHFKYDFVNLGEPGASVHGIVSNLMHYFKVYGNPEFLFCMFPDFERMHVFLNKDITMSRISDADGFQEIHLAHVSDYNDRPKYAKKPFDIEDVMPNEIAYYYSLKAIQSLEQYCDAAGIKFLWSMFHEPDHEAIKQLKNNEFGYYSNFIDTKQNLWTKNEQRDDCLLGDEENECHKELEPLYGTRFHLGGDTEMGKERAHYGVHRHVHTADIFIGEIEKRNENSWNK